jgi:hypothetical protein
MASLASHRQRAPLARISKSKLFPICDTRFHSALRRSECLKSFLKNFGEGGAARVGTATRRGDDGSRRVAIQMSWLRRESRAPFSSLLFDASVRGSEGELAHTYACSRQRSEPTHVGCYFGTGAPSAAHAIEARRGAERDSVTGGGCFRHARPRTGDALRAFQSAAAAPG